MRRTTRSERTQESGFAVLMVFVMAAIIAITLYMEMPRVAFESQRVKEQLLVDRGNQYKRAIQVFYRKNKRYPTTMDELEKFQEVRFLRRKYKDPFTGKDEWRIIHMGPGNVLIDSLVQKQQNPLDKDGKPVKTTDGQSGVGNPGFQQTTGNGQLGPNGQPDPNGGATSGLNMATARRASDRMVLTAGPGGPGTPVDGDPNQQPVQPAPYPGQQYPPVQYPQPGQYPGQPGQPGQFPQPGQYPQPSQYPGQPGQLPGQPVQYPGQPGQFPGQPGQPVQPGQYPGQPGQYPGQPGQYPGQPVQPGQFPSQPGQYPSQPGQYPSQPMFPGQPNQPGIAQPGTGQPGVVLLQPTTSVTGPPNPALAMINNAITQPRAGGFNSAGLGSGGSGGIAGVATTYKGMSIKVINERHKYQEWEFVYDLQKDKSIVGAGLPQTQPMPSPLNPGSQPTQPTQR